MYQAINDPTSTPGTAADVDEVLAWACRAPSVHNTQPWSWRVHDTHVELYADFQRQLQHADPQRRDLLISCGAALHHLHVAAAALGWTAHVRRAPDPRDERWIASIELSRTGVPANGAEVLSDLSRRTTDRRHFTSWPVPHGILTRLADAGNARGARVVPIEQESTRARLERLTRRADVLQHGDPRYVDEMASWVTSSGDQGVPAGHVPRAEEVDTSDALNRRFTGGTLSDPEVDHEPPADGMLLICTSSDDTVSRVRAGEALSAVWLLATRENLSVVPLSQSLEVPEIRQVLQEEVLDDLAFAQLVVRVGWPPVVREPLSPTPRRALEDTRVRY
jgi:nitroreductase